MNIKRTVKDLVGLNDKVVLLRTDFNVPLDEVGRITDLNRVTAALPTIKYLVEQGAKVVILSHLGRPNGYEIKYSLWPISLVLMEKLKTKVYFSYKVTGKEVRDRVRSMGNGDVLLLENIRFYQEEEKCDLNFAREIALMGDVYVNDAFGCSHRKHASTYGLARLMPNAIGLLMEKEVRELRRAMETPKRPFVAIIGGAKVPDKIKILKRFVDVADTILIGGAMAYTFILAQDTAVAQSLVYYDCVNVAREILDYAASQGKKILLPVDHVVDHIDDHSRRTDVVEQMEDDMMGMDIGPKTVELFKNEIAKAGQIVWNGPLGKYEDPRFREGTFKIAKAVADSKAYSVVGGGDSVSAIKECKVASKINFLSTGGGATLKFIEEGTLPCLEVIQERIK